MTIDDLYQLIPPFQCKEGCTECCKRFGIPSRTPIEDERIKKFLAAQGLSPGIAVGTRCPYVTETGCSIYPVRPLICRIYGTSPNYRCIMGLSPVEPLHPDLEAEIFELYRRYFFGTDRP